MLYTSRLELRVAKNHGDLQQAYYLALAGVETTKALIHEEAVRRKNSVRHFRSSLSDSPGVFKDIQLGRGLFRIVRGPSRDEGSGRLIHGIRDEEAGLNVNTATLEELKRLPGMTSDVAAAIVDWRDRDSKLTPEGAEMDYYAGLDEPSAIRNGPFETLRELLRVRGVTEELLLGEDANFNGILDPEERDGNKSYPPDDGDSYLRTGWSGWLTVHSKTPNLNARGEPRVNIASADADELAEVDGISAELAAGIVAYREKEALKTIGQLLDVRVVIEQPQRGQVVFASGNAPAPGSDARIVNATGAAPSVTRTVGETGNRLPAAVPQVQQSDSSPGSNESNREASGGNSGQVSFGEKLINEQLFQDIADDVTTNNRRSIPGLININSAEAPALACIPGIEPELAEAIVEQRRQYGDYSSIAGLLDVSGMTQDIFKKVCHRLTARSATYRILSEGLVPSTSARKRIEVVVRQGLYEFDTLSYREGL